MDDAANWVSESKQVSSATLLANLVDAAEVVAEAKARRDGEVFAAGQRELLALVQAARDRGVSWQAIGDAVGLRRGAAYKRFRHAAVDAT